MKKTYEGSLTVDWLSHNMDEGIQPYLYDFNTNTTVWLTLDLMNNFEDKRVRITVEELEPTKGG